MAHRFTEAELAVFKETFLHFDLDGDGVISSRELATVMRSLEHLLLNLKETFTDEKVNEMIKHADENADGKVTYDEFVKMLAEK
ncbi:calmodulin-like [Elgaria multicarinata webbii]|uniref:calmodulin-like n=1 Tax=Elgaria multicarinata webbii TaxID=159646 RepID=UPI002FCD53A7